jgi:hypothetical protein
MGTASVMTGSTRPAGFAPRARGGQDPESAGEHQDQHGADEELRGDRCDGLDAGEGGAHDATDPAAAHRPDEGADHREHPREQQGERRDEQRRRQIRREQIGDRLLAGVGIAELQRRDAPELRQVLHDERLLQPVGLLRPGDGLGPGLGAGPAHDRFERVARDPQREEHHRGGEPHHEQRRADPPRDGARDARALPAG